MDGLTRKNKDSRAIHTLTDPYPGDPAKPSYRLRDSESCHKLNTGSKHTWFEITC